MRVAFDDVFARVDHGLSLPLYLQITAQVEQALRRGGLAPGVDLPPERELSSRFGVALSTVRRALAALEEKGVVVRRRGRGGGTSIAPSAPIARVPGTFETVFDVISASSRRPETQLVKAKKIIVDERFSRQSRFPPDSKVVFLLRYRSADGSPIAVFRNWIREDYVKFDLDRLSRESLEMTLRSTGITVNHVDFEFVPTTVGDAGEFFELPASDPALNEVRHTYDDVGMFHYSHHLCHPVNEKVSGVSVP